jgi:DNA-binding CsgD family transcriptional regulator
MTKCEYTIDMHKGAIIRPGDLRWLNLATHLAVVVIGVLGVGGLTSPLTRLLFALLCAAFTLVNMVAARSGAIARRPHAYVAAQTLLFLGLVALRSSSDAYTFLLFILSIQASILFPGRVAARWSDRETEVLRLVVTGATNREIAAALVIAEATVRNHLTNILDKLEVSDRTQAAVKAKALGLV